jgi:hypothetical protein
MRFYDRKILEIGINLKYFQTKEREVPKLHSLFCLEIFDLGYTFKKRNVIHVFDKTGL